ncbi:MAG: bifunctional 4-hydroxy-2-oxoglutarate aldolase/2-dehydro-3-deoxy-phosphogluconate aldolase [Brevinema sp.]
MNILEKFLTTKIIPVAVIQNEKELRALAELCVKYAPSLELTLRSEFALTAISLLKKDYPSITVAAATVLSPDDADKAMRAGADLIISPGFTPNLLKYAQDKNYPYIPGVSTPSEIEQCLLAGYRILKAFPIEVIGGIKWLKAMEPVYQHYGVKFIPLGGLSPDNTKTYLQAPNVISCGGTWLAPRDLIEADDWGSVEERFVLAQRLGE